MITLACLECHLALRTTGEVVELDFLVGKRSDWYPDRYPCPRSDCNGKMTLTDVIDIDVLPLLEVRELTPQECFQAFNGLGLPEERECSAKTVHAALVGKTIASVELGALENATRAIIFTLYMADGTRVYLGSSPQGALVYRIAQPRSKEILGE